MEKQIIIGLMALLLMSVFSVAVMAEEAAVATADESIQAVDQATVAEVNDELNESVSAVDIGMAKIGLWFTFSQEKKAEKELKLARLELIRAKNAALNNNTKAMEKALEAHERIIARVQNRINAIDGAFTKEGAKESVTKLVGLERAIQVHEARIAKLGEILSSGNLTEEQIVKIQARLDQAENNTAHLKEVEAAKIDKIKTKLMAVANMTKEEAEDEIEEIEDAQDLTAVRKLVAEVKIARAEKFLENIQEKIAKAEIKEGINASKATEKLTLVQQKLESKAEYIKEQERTRERAQKSEEIESENGNEGSEENESIEDIT